jgi:hypothetical protein
MLVVSDHWIAGLFRTKILAKIAAFAMRREAIRRLAFRTISQIGIRYRKSPLSRNLAGLSKIAPQAGDRFPWLRLKLSDGGPVEDLFERLDDLRWNLVIVGQSEAANEAHKLGAMVRTLIIPANSVNEKELARAQLTEPCFYLLRPDGHVGLAGKRFEAATIIRYLTDNGIRVNVLPRPESCHAS